MSTLTVKPHATGMAIPTIRRVPASSPWLWLGRGWRDFRRSWPVSLGYGAVFSALGWLLLAWTRESPHLAMTLVSGFLLVGPFLAIGFYAISSRMEHKLDAGGPLQPLCVVRRNAASIGLFALMLAFILSAWERISALLVGLFFSSDLIASGRFSLGLLFDGDHLGFVAAYFLVGGVLAALVFAFSAVSLPMLIDRPVDTVTAVLTSFWTVWHNPMPMLVWAALIVALTVAGLATALVGLAIAFPVLGHATWHAYRDLVVRN
jgi:uncharacterized membrane protein